MIVLQTHQNGMMKAARLLERQLIEDMLKSSKIGEFSSEFSKAPGSDQFASFMRESYAERLSHSGTFGIAEAIFERMTSHAK